MTLTGDYAVFLPFQKTASAHIDIASLVQDHSAVLFRVANSVLRSASEAEDVVQDVFLRVLQHHATLADVREMRVWLVRIAWNLALDRKRKARPDQMDTQFVETLITREIPADQALAEIHQLQTVLREIDRLPGKERQVLLLSAIEELTTSEIAQVLGKTESAIRSTLFRARTRLRERLDHQGRR